MLVYQYYACAKPPLESSNPASALQMQTVLTRSASPLQLQSPPHHHRYWNLVSVLLQNQLRSGAGRLAYMSAAAPATCSHLWSRVIEVYDKAQASGAVKKTDTKVQVCEDGNIAFVLRLASALKSKPKGLSGSAASGAAINTTSSQQQQQQPSNNPFLPYEEALWVQHLSATHTLLLNKFNVVPHHVLVVTRQFESQQEPLNANDLAATQQVLSSMPRGGVAFYNCGPHSGRSQPHKHLQIVPLPFSDDNSDQQQQQQQADCHGGTPVDHVIMSAQAAAGAAMMQPFSLDKLPYRAYAVVLDRSAAPEQLAAAADELLLLCQAGLPAPVSYNVAMTQRFLLMVPRRQEMCGGIAINSLGFAGTILLRSEEELTHAVKIGPLSMLAEVGQPRESLEYK